MDEPFANRRRRKRPPIFRFTSPGPRCGYPEPSRERGPAVAHALQPATAATRGFRRQTVHPPRGQTKPGAEVQHRLDPILGRQPESPQDRRQFRWNLTPLVRPPSAWPIRQAPVRLPCRRPSCVLETNSTSGVPPPRRSIAPRCRAGFGPRGEWLLMMAIGQISIANCPARNANRSWNPTLRWSKFLPVTGSCPHTSKPVAPPVGRNDRRPPAQDRSTVLAAFWPRLSRSGCYDDRVRIPNDR